MKIGVWLAALMVAGCAHQRLHPGAADEAFVVLPPAAWGCAFQVQQRLSTEREQSHQQLSALVEISPSSLKMVGLSGLGLKLFVLEQDAEGVVEWTSLLPLPEGFDPLFVLRDFQLAYLPASVLKSALQPGWSVQSMPADGRNLYRDGALMVEITRQAGDAWGGEMRLSNLEQAYTLTAQTLSVSAYGGAAVCPRPLQ